MYDGVVKAKEQAQQQYTEAVSRGQSAGLVRYMDHIIVETHTGGFFYIVFFRRPLCVLYFFCLSQILAFFLQNTGYFEILQMKQSLKEK